ncbi:hypothetical protein NIES3275_54970 [Microchaete diplosiphon NIES-3275]|nr:hypothetical protein NIES3275_54970 [Microchaete diplosiphon NIES-3275]
MPVPLQSVAFFFQIGITISHNSALSTQHLKLYTQKL